MYLVMRKYKKITGNKQELQSKINSGFLPLVEKIDGFVDYYCLMPDDSTLVSISVFQDQKGADASVKTAADWVAKNLAAYFPEKPEIISGEVFTGSDMQQMKRAA
jgi:hypothetical protein